MRILLAVLLILIFVPGWSGDPRLPLLGDDAVIRADPVALFPETPDKRRIGALTYLGGVQLSSPDPVFGGFSSLSVAGDRFTLLSDGGNIVRFRMGADWRIADTSFGNLIAGPGAGWRKRDRDSESMAVDPATGKHWIGFEYSNAIWRYGPDLITAQAHAAPPAMADWPDSSGPEAMARLPGGGFVVLSEDGEWPNARGHAAIRFSGDPTRTPRRGFRFAYAPPQGYDPSDMAVLPDGRLIVLNRAVSLSDFFTAKLTIVDPADIAPGRLVHGREIATFAAPARHDNFEGLTVTREDGDTILWMVSDDNLSLFQQTLLLKFRLSETPAD